MKIPIDIEKNRNIGEVTTTIQNEIRRNIARQFVASIFNKMDKTSDCLRNQCTYEYISRRLQRVHVDAIKRILRCLNVIEDEDPTLRRSTQGLRLLTRMLERISR